MRNTYWLLCPGICAREIGYPFKPLKEDIQRNKRRCEHCRSMLSEDAVEAGRARHRMMTAMCLRCQNDFSECSCAEPGAATKETFAAKLLTEAGAKHRAQQRDKRRDLMTYTCRSCMQRIPETELTTAQLGHYLRTHFRWLLYPATPPFLCFCGQAFSPEKCWSSYDPSILISIRTRVCFVSCVVQHIYFHIFYPPGYMLIRRQSPWLWAQCLC